LLRRIELSKVSEAVEELVKPIAENFGLEIVEVEYVKKPNGNNLTIFIDKNGGVTIDDCEAFHRAIDEPLDKLDPTNGVSYILNVSSCGLDRPLKNLKDYLRNVGNKVDVKFYKPFNGQKVLTGKIVDANENILTIEDDNQSVFEINIDIIASVLPVVEFN